ncbi:hypothetical protein N9L92_00425 [Saprospiraceae bacterium]|nr:hypothetical protein [Saprospiraceae bacterium]
MRLTFTIILLSFWINASSQAYVDCWTNGDIHIIEDSELDQALTKRHDDDYVYLIIKGETITHKDNTYRRSQFKQLEQAMFNQDSKEVILVIHEDVTMKFFSEVGCILTGTNLFLDRVEVCFYR